jgi:hypothetical protein
MSYIEKLIAFAGEQKIAPGVIAHVQIAHDLDCPLLLHGGDCNCEVDISLMEDPYKSNRQQRRSNARRHK